MHHWLVLLLSALLIAGCGKKGNLSPPPNDNSKPLAPASFTTINNAKEFL
jgi:predicted small lipoprotein YifL